MDAGIGCPSAGRVVESGIGAVVFEYCFPWRASLNDRWGGATFSAFLLRFSVLPPYKQVGGWLVGAMGDNGNEDRGCLLHIVGLLLFYNVIGISFSIWMGHWYRRYAERELRKRPGAQDGN